MLTVYGSATCVPCRNTKKFLTTKGVAFNYVDVTQDADGANTISELGYSGIPVIVTADGEHWSGFDRERMSALV